MKQAQMKKTLLLNLPYFLIGLIAAKLSEAWRLTQGTDMSAKVLHLSEGLAAAFRVPWPSLHPIDLLFGLACGCLLRLIVYEKGLNAKKYRHNEEYGSARWGKPGDIQPFIDPDPWNNVILTKTESLTMNSRPRDPRYARNKNVLVIGGSGSGKTRYFVKPNIMQCTKTKGTSLVVTDPKGSLIVECGKLLVAAGYEVRVFNTINFKKSMQYNPFAYIHSEKDILKFVNTLITNTKGEGKSGEDFWVKCETLLYIALIGYIHYELPPEKQNFATMIDMLNAMDVREDDEEYPGSGGHTDALRFFCSPGGGGRVPPRGEQQRRSQDDPCGGLLPRPAIGSACASRARPLPRRQRSHAGWQVLQRVV